MWYITSKRVSMHIHKEYFYYVERNILLNDISNVVFTKEGIFSKLYSYGTLSVYVRSTQKWHSIHNVAHGEKIAAHLKTLIAKI